MTVRAAAKRLIPLETIERLIVVLRGHRVMLDRDLAELYGVPVKRLNEQVKRNRERFPDDFMFRLTLEEGEMVVSSRSQIATLNVKQGRNLKYQPYVFSEHGAIMLANVLRSPVAVKASIQVVRAFVNLRSVVAANESLLRKVEAIGLRVDGHDVELQDVIQILRKLLEPPQAPRKNPIGFVAAKAKAAAAD
jgi:hypothetical protein